jgi:aspartate/methionine/tyrosine aminotransferase
MQLPPFRLERFFAEHEFTAPYLLCASDAETLRIDELLALEPGARERFLALGLGYTEATGGRALREAIAATSDRLEPEGVLVHTGAGEAIFTFMHAALAPGDHAVVHAPGYQSLAEVARAAGAEVSGWRGDPARGWALDLADLRRLLRPNTRLVVVNTPHNPTGWLADLPFLQELAEMADAHGFRIFADEVYRGLEYDPSSRLPLMVDRSERATSLGVLSKSSGLAGLRIGWLASHDRELLARASAIKDYTTICNSGPSEFLATIAVRQQEAITARVRAIVLRNLDLLDPFFARWSGLFRWQRPLAGPIAFPAFLAGDVDAFCREAVAGCGVLLLPGTLYGEGDQAVRVGFGRDNLPEALAALEGWLERSRFAR